ncbi:head maturation protease, ClpP-related [Pseudoalteromonas sp. T1lg22]|uniref:head maturation protease, ClpP-related n=1 Tax=Pseudoalteromonas sp. T1lg22 TaxID=2077096 RepID=UPI000CF66333|nr:head maturation protease, ClpP-related [Pseudoalteromonas sp. T1lg22]
MNNNRKLMQLIQNNCQNRDQIGYQVKQQSPLANAGDSRPAFLIYDVIDPWWGVSAETIKRDLLSITDATDIDVFINSPGGDVFEATAIAASFKAHPAKIHVHIDGIAASAATRIALAGDTIEIAESGFYMIHYAWTLALGNAKEIRDTADMLDKVDNTIVTDYEQRTNAGEEQVRTWMEAETWFTAQEALEHGFVDSIMQGANTEPTNNKTWDLSSYHNAPEPQAPQNKFPQRERLERFANMLLKTG